MEVAAALRYETISEIIALTKNPLLDGLNAVYRAAKADNQAPRYVLRDFQLALKRIAAWTVEAIEKDLARFDVARLEELVGRLREHGAEEGLELRDLVHDCYLAVARELWRKPYLMYDNVPRREFQENQLLVEKIVVNAMKQLLRRATENILVAPPPKAAAAWKKQAKQRGGGEDEYEDEDEEYEDGSRSAGSESGYGSSQDLDEEEDQAYEGVDERAAPADAPPPALPSPSEPRSPASSVHGGDDDEEEEEDDDVEAAVAPPPLSRADSVASLKSVQSVVSASSDRAAAGDQAAPFAAGGGRRPSTTADDLFVPRLPMERAPTPPPATRQLDPAAGAIKSVTLDSPAPGKSRAASVSGSSYTSSSPASSSSGSRRSSSSGAASSVSDHPLARSRIRARAAAGGARAQLAMYGSRYLPTISSMKRRRRLHAAASSRPDKK